MEYYYETSDELYHYGRKGMKWGQHIFGKIKAARTAHKRKVNLKKAREARAERKRLLESGKISPNKMTKKELQDRIARLELEKKYNELKKDSKQHTAASRFISKFKDSVIDKTAENAIADVVAQAIKVGAVNVTNKAIGEEVVYTNNKKK